MTPSRSNASIDLTSSIPTDSTPAVDENGDANMGNDDDHDENPLRTNEGKFTAIGSNTTMACKAHLVLSYLHSTHIFILYFQLLISSCTALMLS